MASWTSYITAGWGIIGSIKNQLQELAWDTDTDITFSVSAGLLSRTVSFKVTGTEENVALFRRAVFNGAEAMGAEYE